MEKETRRSRRAMSFREAWETGAYLDPRVQIYGLERDRSRDPGAEESIQELHSLPQMVTGRKINTQDQRARESNPSFPKRAVDRVRDLGAVLILGFGVRA